MATDPTQLLNNLSQNAGLNGVQIQNQVNQWQQERQQQQIGQMQIAAAQAQAAQQAQYQTDVQSYFRDPSSSNLSMLVAKYPQQAEALQKSYAIMDQPRIDNLKTQYGQIYSSADQEKPEALSQSIGQIITAEKGRGINTADAQQLKDALDSGDPSQIAGAVKAAKAYSQLHLSALDPKFATALGIGKGGDTHVISPGGALTDDNGRVLYKNEEAAPKYQTVKNADGSESIVQLGGSGASAPTQTVPAGGAGAPLSVRLNNPGAIRYTDANKWQGQVGSEHGFVQFDTPENGQRAQRILLSNQIKQGYDTPLAWANHYAPASDGNNPTAYAQSIAKGLGIGVGDKIPLSAVPKMAQLSAQVEAGGTPAPAHTDYSAISPGQAAKVVFTSKGKDGDATTGGLSQDGLNFAADWAIAHGGKAPPGFARNKDAQVALQNAIADRAKNAGLSVQDVINKGQDFVTEQQTLNAFAKGKQGDAVRSGSVALNHLALFHDAINALQNGNVPAFNHFSQVWQKATGSPLPTNAEALKGVVSDEVNKAILAGNGALADRKDVRDQLDISGSPQQILGSVNGYINLLGGQLSGLKRQYETGTKRNDFESKLSPTAVGVLRRAEQMEAGAPQVGMVKNGYRFKGGNPADPASWAKM